MESTITTTWQRVLDDPALRNLPYKVETNETGQIILSPHKPWHSLQQGRIMRLLLSHMQEPGEPAVEDRCVVNDENRLGDPSKISSSLHSRKKIAEVPLHFHARLP